MKPALLKFLPHLFRVIEDYGFILPRKFFMPASEYKMIPSRLKVDNVMPSVSDLPGLLTSIRHPGRGRAVSVGPQSAADAYETLAYREKRRRDSLTSSSDSSAAIPRPERRSQSHSKDYFSDSDKNGSAQVSGISPVSGNTLGVGNLPTPAQSRVSSYEQMMGQGKVLVTPATPPINQESTIGDEDEDIVVIQQNELEEKEMFSQLMKPRVRYDVEVVTKLVVYAGIGWIAVEIGPIIFELIGLGMGSHVPVR